MTATSRCSRLLLVSTLTLAAALPAQQRPAPVALRPTASVAPSLPAVPIALDSLAPQASPAASPVARESAAVALQPEVRRRTPRWVRWGLIGAAAGAVTFPLLGSLASDEESRPVRDAAAGAAVGFVVVGGGIALFDAVCGGDSRARRGGWCG